MSRELERLMNSAEACVEVALAVRPYFGREIVARALALATERCPACGKKRWNLAQAAERAGVSRGTLQYWIARGVRALRKRGVETDR